MLNSNSHQSFGDNELPQIIDINKLFAIGKRQWKVVAISCGVALVLGLVFALTAVPRYTAYTNLFIDANNSQIVDQLSAINGIPDSDASVLSQVEILKSSRIAEDVIDKLNLMNDPDFTGAMNSPLANAVSTIKSLIDFRTWFSSSDATLDSQDAQRQLAVTSLLNGIDAERVGQTYLLSLSYTSTSPTLAAKVANAFANAYLEDQLSSKYEATRRAGDWLQKRIDELRKNALASDLAVQKYKSDNGLISTGGQLVSEQQLTQLNSQLIIAQSETTSAKAKLDRIENIIKTGQMDASVNGALDSTVIANLQTKFLEASRLEADIEKRLGPTHLQALRLKADMQEYKRLMFEELSRIAAGYSSDYKVALQRQKSLEDQVAQATGISSSANSSQVQLRELERESDTYQKLYETYLQHFQQSAQQESFPITEARVISKADVPILASYPKKPLVMAVALLLGMMVGAAIGLFREIKDQYFRLGEQIRGELNLEFLGQVPLTSTKPLDEGVIENEPQRGSRLLKKTNSINNYVVDHPLSSFAETLRSAKLAADISALDKTASVIGVVSTLPREGKSTIAMNFAYILALQGARTLLIDADLRNPGASRALAPQSERGLFEIITEKAFLPELLFMDPKTKLAFLPNLTKRRIPYSAELLASNAMTELLNAAKTSFDYIVVDLPPMGAVVDARAIADKIDSYIMVVEWGRTKRSLVRSALRANAAIAEKCVGVVLNKVDLKKQNLYVEQEENYYNQESYRRYYNEESNAA